MTSKARSDPGDDIQIEIAEKGPVVRSLVVEVDRERVSKAYDRAYRGLAKNASVRGFRRGKVPRGVLEKLYAASLREEIGQRLVSETLPEALQRAELEPVSQPEVEVPAADPSAPFRYSAQIEIKPEIVLPELEGLPGRRPAVVVAESELDERLDSLRARRAPLIEEPEQTLAARGHHLCLHYEGRVDGRAFEGGSAKDFELELGSGSLIPGFEDQLEGVRAGEDREVEVRFPDDYPEQSLRGRQAEFSVHVKNIRRRQLPDLDDEFAKDLGDFATLSELREQIRSDLQTGRERDAQGVLEQSVMDSLLERVEFEVPPGLVQRQLERQLESMERQFSGRVPAASLRAQLSRMREEGRPAAERRVRETLLLEAVVGERNFEIDDSEVDARLDELSAARGGDPAQLRQLAREQGWAESIRDELSSQKALDFLVAKAKVEETTDT